MSTKLQQIARRRNWRIPWIKGAMSCVRLIAHRINAFDLLSDINELENKLYEQNNRHWQSQKKDILEDET